MENHQLRQERDILMQKLIRSKGALKETLDRLATSSDGTRQSPGARLSPLPPRKSLMTSANVLESVGSAPSRAKVTQDLVEFAHTQVGKEQK